MAEESVLIPLHSVIALSLDILDHFVTKCVLKDFMALDVTTSVLVIIFQDVILKMEVARAKQDGEGSPAISVCLCITIFHFYLSIIYINNM
jgi:hypothetical protein